MKFVEFIYHCLTTQVHFIRIVFYKVTQIMCIFCQEIIFVINNLYVYTLQYTCMDNV